MSSNVIAFAARAAVKTRRDTISRSGRGQDNVISFAGCINRALPRRTPTGVFFTTRVLLTIGDLA